MPSQKSLWSSAILPPPSQWMGVVHAVWPYVLSLLWRIPVAVWKAASTASVLPTIRNVEE